MNYLDYQIENLKSDLSRLKSTISAIEIAMQHKPPIGYDVGQALIQAAASATATLAKIDALSRIEKHLPNNYQEDKYKKCNICGQPQNSILCQKNHP